MDGWGLYALVLVGMRSFALWGLLEAVVFVRMRADALRERGLVHGESLAAELPVLMERRVSSTNRYDRRVDCHAMQ